MTSTYVSQYHQAMMDHRLTDPSRDQPPYRAHGYSVVVVSAVTEIGIVRCIGYGWGPHTLPHYAPFVKAVLRIVGTPGLGTIGQPIEWTGYVYRIPHYVMRCIDREALPRGVYLYRRHPADDSERKVGWDWSFCFEDVGEFVAPLPQGW